MNQQECGDSPHPIIPEVFEVLWPVPSPLEGVKTRNRVLFDVPSAYFKNAPKSDNHGANTFSGLKLTLESRVAAVGCRIGRSAAELLLGSRQLLIGRCFRHDGLVAVHLGPHLLDDVGQTPEQYLVAAAVALEQRPHVVVLDEALDAANEAWSQAFRRLLCCEAMRRFQGAVVVCVAEETPVVRQICQYRWTGAGEWIWQEDITDNSFEFLEDALNKPIDEALMKEVRELGTQEPFSEDIVEVAKAKGWTLTLLTMSASRSAMQDNPQGDDNVQDNPQDCPTQDEVSDIVCSTRKLIGYICYTMWPGRIFRITRLIVAEPNRDSGFGRQLMRWGLERAAQMPISQVAWIALNSLSSEASYFERFGLWDMTSNDTDNDDQSFIWMEMPNRAVVSENEPPIRL